MTYRPGDLVKFTPEHTQALSGIDPALIGMVGMVLNTQMRKDPDDDEYLPILWADGETFDTHVNDLEPAS